MEFNTFKKKTIQDEKVIMTEPTILFKENIDIIVEHTVTDYELGRPDLIALKYYRDQSNADIILKFNGISNPFSINLNDVLEIPVLVTEFNKFIKPGRQTGDSKKDLFIKQRRMTEKDIKRLEFLQTISERGALPPNRLKTNDVNKRIDSETTSLNPSNFNE